MSNNLKAGDKLLLPVTHEKPGINSQFFLTDTGYHVLLDQPETDTLIPASTLTDLQAENAKIRTALTIIVDMLEQPNSWRQESAEMYRTAVKALGGGE